jgi:multidrug transporter EmrE-like cation transporter
VPFSVQLGLLLAVATAFASIVGFLYKQRGAAESPAIEWRRPIQTSLSLFRSRWYTLGIVIAMGSWGLHSAALALAPISLVQSVIAGGLVLLTVVADRLFGFEVTRREWIGVAFTAAGLAFLAATLAGVGESRHSDWQALQLTLYVSIVTAAGAAAATLAGDDERGGLALAVSAGLLWGASDVSIKALSVHTDDGLGVLLHPLALVILLLSLVGLTVSARSLQLGKAVPVIAITGAAANVITIVAGPAIFGEPLPDHPLGVALRVLAFALVIVASALTPGPVRAARVEPETAPA